MVRPRHEASQEDKSRGNLQEDFYLAGGIFHKERNVGKSLAKEVGELYESWTGDTFPEGLGGENRQTSHKVKENRRGRVLGTRVSAVGRGKGSGGSNLTRARKKNKQKSEKPSRGRTKESLENKSKGTGVNVIEGKTVGRLKGQKIENKKRSFRKKAQSKNAIPKMGRGEGSVIGGGRLNVPQSLLSRTTEYQKSDK